MRISSSACMCSAVEKAAGNDQLHDLVGTFEDLVDTDIPEIPLDLVILDVSIAAVQLQGIIAHFEGNIGRETFGHCAGDGRIPRLGIELASGSVDHQPRRLQLGRHLREAELQGLEIRQSLPELPALEEVRAGPLEAGAGGPEGARPSIDPPAIQPPHGDLESLAFL